MESSVAVIIFIVAIRYSKYKDAGPLAYKGIIMAPNKLPNKL